MNNQQSISLPSNPAKSQMIPTSLVEPELIGFLIYRPDTEEFFHSGTFGLDRTKAGYTKEPAYAYAFSSSRAAYGISCAIEKPTQIVELYDTGGKLAVMFE